jgi:hypothetical protein
MFQPNTLVGIVDWMEKFRSIISNLKICDDRAILTKLIPD